MNAHQHFEFSIGNDEIMQKVPLKSVTFMQKVPFILYIAVPTNVRSVFSWIEVKSEAISSLLFCSAG
jgi:hypothetical protein